MQDDRDADQQYPVSFTGSGSEYFRIWIVNILFTICTLYIYSAWAKVRTRRYFYGNTLLDGSAFEYHARGLQLLPGRLVGLALVLLIAFAQYLPLWSVGTAYGFLILITPWAVCRSTMFNARMSSYRNIRFGFDGTVWPYYKYLLLIPFTPLALTAAAGVALYYTDASEKTMNKLAMALPLALLFIYFFWPWMQSRLTAYTIDHSKYGTVDFDTRLKTTRFYGVYLVGIAIFMAAFVAIVAIGSAIVYLLHSYGVSINFDKPQETFESPVGAAVFVGAYGVVILLGYFAGAYISSRLRNYQYNRTLLDGKFQLSSNIRMWPLWRLNISNLVIIIITLGLGYPWAAVRKARFMANHTQVISSHSPDLFVEQQRESVSAMGEELGDALDLDFVIGI